MPFADDKVLFLVTEVENSWQWLSALLQEAPDAQVLRLGPEVCWQSDIVPWGAGLEKAGMRHASPGTHGWALERSSVLEQWHKGPLGGS